jgi:regulator of sigma E protease
MGDFWIKAAQLLLSLSILIVLHELGHMIPAKLFKTRVEKFYLFFNPYFSLFKKKIGETEYGIGWLPLGGFVKISGMVDESMDKDQMSKPPEPWEFRSKPAWQRLIIMLGGVVVNLILGFLIYMMVLGVWGRDYVKHEHVDFGFSATSVAEAIGFQDGDQIKSVNGKELFSVLDISRHLLMRGVKTVEVTHPGSNNIVAIEIPEDFGMTMWTNGQEIPLQPIRTPIIDSVHEESGALAGGMLKGDSITAINGDQVQYWYEFAEIVSKDSNTTYTVDVFRNGKIIPLQVKNDSVGEFGIECESPKDKSMTVSHRDYSFGEALSEGFAYGYWTLHDYVVQFKYVFTAKGATQIGGFGAIGKMFPSEWDWHQFWLNTALISIILAFMNLLPIPALDGGHVIFLLWEMVTGRAVSQKIMERAQVVGMVLLLGLLLYANGLDVVKAIFN